MTSAIAVPPGPGKYTEGTIPRQFPTPLPGRSEADAMTQAGRTTCIDQGQAESLTMGCLKRAQTNQMVGSLDSV